MARSRIENLAESYKEDLKAQSEINVNVETTEENSAGKKVKKVSSVKIKVNPKLGVK